MKSPVPGVPLVRRRLQSAIRDAKQDGLTLVYMGPLRYTHPTTGESCAGVLGAVVGDLPSAQSVFSAYVHAEERLQIPAWVADEISEGFDGNPSTSKWAKLGRELRAGAIDYADWQHAQLRRESERARSRPRRKHK